VNGGSIFTSQPDEIVLSVSYIADNNNPEILLRTILLGSSDCSKTLTQLTTQCNRR
jgi:hypothetical protein